MESFVLDLYSNGDLYMMMAKVIAYMILFMFMGVILGCFRGLRL